MALDDLLPDNVETDKSSSSNKSSGRKKPDEKEYATKVVGPNGKAKFLTEEQLEKVKRVITEETPYSPQEVLNNFPQERRYKVVHDAVTFTEDGLDEENVSRTRCYICGKDCSYSNVEIEGELFCPHHTAGQVRKELDNDGN